MRLYASNELKSRLTHAAANGSVIAADILSRIVVPGQVLPIGVITASVGAPLFIYLLLRQDADVSR